MAYVRREVTDGVTIMNKDLYDNVQDGIDEAKQAVKTLREEVLPTEVKTVVLQEILVIE